MLSEKQKELALGLFDIGAVKFGQFRLKLHEKNPDAPLSPIYIDLRILRSFPRVMSLAVSVYEELSRGLDFEVYADVPTAATPIVAILSHSTVIPMISPRLDAKAHGTRASIDGDFKAGQVVLVVDDLITKAESKLEAISTLEEKGLQVRDIIVLVDREQGGADELASRGYTCRSAYKLGELLSFYLDSGRINQETYNQTVDYLKAVS